MQLDYKKSIGGTMTTLKTLLFAALAIGSTAHATPDRAGLLTGETVICTDPSGTHSHDIQLEFIAAGAYHRDGYWYDAEYNGPVVHTYVFASSLHSGSSGRLAGIKY